MKTVLTSQATRVRTWLRATVLGTGAVLCGAVLAATPIPSGPLVTTDWLAQNLDVASRTIIWSLVKQMRVCLIPLFHRLHRRTALER